MLSFMVLSAFICDVRWLMSPWYLFMFFFSKFSMPCLLIQLHQITLRWERHDKREVVREKECERDTLWKKKDTTWRAWERKMWQEKRNTRIVRHRKSAREWERKMEGTKETRRQLSEKETQP
jgi:hypothetical protein